MEYLRQSCFRDNPKDALNFVLRGRNEIFSGTSLAGLGGSILVAFESYCLGESIGFGLEMLGCLVIEIRAILCHKCGRENLRLATCSQAWFWEVCWIVLSFGRYF